MTFREEIIGNQRLILGDSREVIDGLPQFDALVSDPPFGIGFQYQEKEATSSPEAYADFLLPIVAQCNAIAKDGALFALWQAQPYFKHFWKWFGDDIHIYCAAKNFVQLRKTPINYAYDPVVMWYKTGKPLRPEKPSRNVDFFMSNTAGIISDTSRLERGHPCPRPLDVVSAVVGNFTIDDGLVLDPFMGSGTTLLAAEANGRRGIGIEISPEYFDIACRRVEQVVQAVEHEEVQTTMAL